MRKLIWYDMKKDQIRSNRQWSLETEFACCAESMD